MFMVVHQPPDELQQVFKQNAVSMSTFITPNDNDILLGRGGKYLFNCIIGFSSSCFV